MTWKARLQTWLHLSQNRWSRPRPRRSEDHRRLLLASCPGPRRQLACSSWHGAGNSLEVTHPRRCVWGRSWFGSESPGPGSWAEPGGGRTTTEPWAPYFSATFREEIRQKGTTCCADKRPRPRPEADAGVSGCSLHSWGGRPALLPPRPGDEGRPDGPVSVSVDQCPGGRFTDRWSESNHRQEIPFPDLIGILY